MSENQYNLKVGVIGGTGAMASPMAIHWRESECITVMRVLDRGRESEFHSKVRAEWEKSKVQLVKSVEEVYGQGELDGFFICVGKNGDDAPILKELVRLIKNGKQEKRLFICHLSTVSVRFVELATAVLGKLNIDYVNYPLTGGPIGACEGSMLILCSGEKNIFEKLNPALKQLGRPKYFGPGPTQSAQVKLMGHMMVFNGLMGICSAAAVHSVQFQQGEIGGDEQVEFFDFLNKGAGGTRQWDVILKNGIKDNLWHGPFLARYGLLDAIYTVELMRDSGLVDMAIINLINVAASLLYVVSEKDQELGTQAILKEMYSGAAKNLNSWLREISEAKSVSEKLDMLSNKLSDELKHSLKLEVVQSDFI